MDETSNLLENSINTIFSKIFSSLDNSFYHILDNLCFIDKSILDNSVIKTFIGFGINEGMLAICNSLILGIIIYYSIKYLFSHLIYIKSESPKEFIIKAIIFGILMNNSIWFCEQLISLIHFCSSFMLYHAEKFTSKTISFSEFLTLLNTSLFWTNSTNDLISFSGIVKSFSSVGLINLVFTFSLRYILTIVLIILSPLAFLSLFTSSSTPFFKAWFKAFFSILFFQIIITLLLIIAFSFGKYSNTLLICVFYVGIIKAFERTGYFVKELIGGLSLNILNSFNSII